jgi:hypothetical protein
MADESSWEYLYSGIQDRKARHLKLHRPGTYRVLSEQHPPLASQYPKGGLADTPGAIEELYRKYREAQRKLVWGGQVRFHWRW